MRDFKRAMHQAGAAVLFWPGRKRREKKVSNTASIFIRLLAGLIIWFCIHSVIFGIAGKDGGMYVLDDNYRIFGWPGGLVKRFEDTPSFTAVNEIKSDIDAFAVLDGYILCKAGDAWYAIDRQKHTISQFADYEQMNDFLEHGRFVKIHLTRSKPWLRMCFFWPAISISIAIGVCIFILFFSKDIKNLILSVLLKHSSGSQI
ncbi:MAG: hypothetical protein JW925_09345 [Syntrophaceae bacterium]|nr:hypothetical protein [Syntrophaceae bacterium]